MKLELSNHCKNMVWTKKTMMFLKHNSIRTNQIGRLWRGVHEYKPGLPRDVGSHLGVIMSFDDYSDGEQECWTLLGSNLPILMSKSKVTNRMID